MSRNYVILVDENDCVLGTEDKLKAHQNGGQRHRAFSVFILNDAGELLLQKRALNKYHAPGLWANSCCSHPQPKENVMQSAQDRLQEELGFTTALTQFSTIEYKADVGNDLTEWELDHLFVGTYNEPVHPNHEEVEQVRWVNINELKNELAQKPHEFTPWLQLLFPHYLASHP